ncbi:MAG: gliding motility-associated C-terminal domain-containing protein [Saprospiraceae bacterium]|nr:gliding motility-associated C-terminal domain-containing protein [Saprospiraceae bacterium]
MKQKYIITLKALFYFSFLVTMFSLPQAIRANHIIGGDMYYECLGFKNNDPRTNKRVFRVYLELYRDCQARNAAYFDNLAHLTIFRGNSAPYTQMAVVMSPYSGPVDIEPPTYPCLTIPPNVCVHKALYTYEVELDISAESYHLVWQRCCRNRSISNIYSPSEIGATFTVEITPLAQQRCNNSPVFKNFPPTVICVDEELLFDHGATDAEGDVIVYEFCAPLIGGGRNFGGNGCDTPNPNPDCPPPYGTVTFRAPQFTTNQPLGYNGNMKIDRTTGMITGKPLIQGQFVVGVCMKEYRNGQLLSTIRRDFQFNVSSCTPNFSAGVEADEIGKNDERIIKWCEGLTVDIQNRSAGKIDSVIWRMDVGDSLYLDPAWNPSITFPEGGEYSGSLIVNPGTPCTDTASFLVRVIEDIKAGFIAEFDTCDAGPIEFQDKSYVLGSAISKWGWDFSARLSDTVQHPVIKYEYPGEYPVKLIIEDDFGCRDTIQKLIAWQPAPEVLIIDPSVRAGCAPLEVNFQNLSYPVDEEYDIRWIFSDGGEAMGLTPSYTFSDTGHFGLKLEVTSPIGCFAERSFENVVAVFSPPEALFELSDNQVSSLDPTIMITDISVNSTGREWLLENYAIYYDSTFTYTFTDTGMNQVRLIVVDRFGCADTLTRSVDVVPFNSLYFPNAFTPNGDGQNDLFKPVGSPDGLKAYNLEIYNRYGELIFKSTEVSDGWDGTAGSGRAVEEDVYIMQYQYLTPRGELIENKGQILLLR